MNPSEPRGLDRNGLDAAFTAEETLKSNLILEGQLLSDQLSLDAAADKFAQAAAIEERLSERSALQGLHDKSSLHLFSAASCWARAGNFYEAIRLCGQLQSSPHLSPRLLQRVQAFTTELRKRRLQWATGLALSGSVE